MSKGINDIQPARLEQALAARGLTKGQLASLVGVAASTVTKWCKGDQAPEAETFERIASVLNLQSEWLTRPLIKPITAPLYRSNASSLKAARSKLEARTEWGQELAVLLSEYVEYPQLNLPERTFEDPEQIDNADIEAAADECRALWQLGRGPIQNLTLAAESAGIIIVREETEISAIEGLSSWSDLLGRPIVFCRLIKPTHFAAALTLLTKLATLFCTNTFLVRMIEIVITKWKSRRINLRVRCCCQLRRFPMRFAYLRIWIICLSLNNAGVCPLRQ